MHQTSIYCDKEIFGADKMIVVTQEYHLYRSLYIAEKLGVEAWGVDICGVIWQENTKLYSKLDR